MFEIFSSMSDEELRLAFEEFREHERTKALQEGIIRSIVNKLEKDGGSNTMLLILNVEHALLREMAIRFYEQP